MQEVFCINKKYFFKFMHKNKNILHIMRKRCIIMQRKEKRIRECKKGEFSYYNMKQDENVKF